MVRKLDAALKRFADVVEDWKGRPMRDIPGAGAAGGLGFGLTAFCDAEIKSGIETILDLVDFTDKINGADLVITGEGKIDGQSIRGKVPIGVAARAAPAGLPVLAIVGDIGKGASAVYEYGIDSIMSTVDRAMPLEEAIARSAECLENAAERACRIIRIGMKIAGV
jgi:glycerate kinase